MRCVHAVKFVLNSLICKTYLTIYACLCISISTWQCLKKIRWENNWLIKNDAITVDTFLKVCSVSCLVWDECETKHMSIAALHCSRTEVFFKRQKHIEFRKVFYKVFNVFFPSTVPKAIYSQELQKNTNELCRPKVQYLFSFYVQ